MVAKVIFVALLVAVYISAYVDAQEKVDCDETRGLIPSNCASDCGPPECDAKPGICTMQCVEGCVCKGDNMCVDKSGTCVKKN